jgi:hypothetical protein
LDKLHGIKAIPKGISLGSSFFVIKIYVHVREIVYGYNGCEQAYVPVQFLIQLKVTRLFRNWKGPVKVLRLLDVVGAFYAFKKSFKLTPACLSITLKVPSGISPR